MTEPDEPIRRYMRKGTINGERLEPEWWAGAEKSEWPRRTDRLTMPGARRKRPASPGRKPQARAAQVPGARAGPMVAGKIK